MIGFDININEQRETCDTGNQKLRMNIQTKCVQ